MATPNRNTHPENASACVLGAWERQQVNAKAGTREARHREAWTFNFNAPHDAMFRAQVRAIVATSDAVGGPQGDYLMRPHLLDLYRAAQCSLNYLDRLDGGLCSALLYALAESDGLDLSNLPESEG